MHKTSRGLPFALWFPGSSKALLLDVRNGGGFASREPAGVRWDAGTRVSTCVGRPLHMEGGTGAGDRGSWWGKLGEREGAPGRGTERRGRTPQGAAAWLPSWAPCFHSQASLSSRPQPKGPSSAQARPHPLAAPRWKQRQSPSPPQAPGHRQASPSEQRVGPPPGGARHRSAALGARSCSAGFAPATKKHTLCTSWSPFPLKDPVKVSPPPGSFPGPHAGPGFSPRLPQPAGTPFTLLVTAPVSQEVRPITPEWPL